MPDATTTTRVQELVPLLFVQDVARSVDFYCRQLGFKLTANWEPDGILQWCRLDRDGAALMLQQACEEDGPPEDRGRGVHFFLNCDDANAEHTRLADTGLELAPPKVAFYGMNQLFLNDPDGYQLCFQHVATES